MACRGVLRLSSCGTAAILESAPMPVEILRFAQDDTFVHGGSSLVVAGRRLGFCWRNGEGGFGATDIFEAVVGAHRNCVFPRCGSAECDFVVFFRRITDAAGWGDKCPITAVDTVLSTLDVACCVSRGELYDDGDECGTTASRHHHHRFELLDYWWSVVHLEALALTLGF